MSRIAFIAEKEHVVPPFGKELEHLGMEIECYHLSMLRQLAKSNKLGRPREKTPAIQLRPLDGLVYWMAPRPLAYEQDEDARMKYLTSAHIRFTLSLLPFLPQLDVCRQSSVIFMYYPLGGTVSPQSNERNLVKKLTQKTAQIIGPEIRVNTIIMPTPDDNSLIRMTQNSGNVASLLYYLLSPFSENTVGEIFQPGDTNRSIQAT